MWTGCTPDLNTMAFNIMGPLFGTAISGALTVAGFAIKGRHPVLSIGLIVTGLASLVDQVTKIYLEGFLTNLYVGSTLDWLVSVIQVGSLAVLIMLFCNTNKKLEITHS